MNGEEEIKEPEIDSQSLHFEIAVTSTGDWPPSCTGVQPVVVGVQKALEAAVAGNQADFVSAKEDVEDAIWDWMVELFGIEGIKGFSRERWLREEE